MRGMHKTVYQTGPLYAFETPWFGVHNNMPSRGRTLNPDNVCVCLMLTRMTHSLSCISWAAAVSVPVNQWTEERVQNQNQTITCMTEQSRATITGWPRQPIPFSQQKEATFTALIQPWGSRTCNCRIILWLHLWGSQKESEAWLPALLIASLPKCVGAGKLETATASQRKILSSTGSK